MCADPSAETLQICKMRAEGSAETLQVLQNARRGVGGDFADVQNARRGVSADFASVARCAARGRRTFCTFFEVSQRLKYHFVEPNHFGIGHPFLELRDDAVGTFLERNIDPVFYHAYGYRSPAKLLT